jgi:hypothetical protein
MPNRSRTATTKSFRRKHAATHLRGRAQSGGTDETGDYEGKARLTLDMAVTLK